MTTAERAAALAETATTKEKIRTWALVSLILYLVSGVAFVGFSTSGGIWYTISDALGLLLGAALMVVVIQFDNLLRPEFGSLSRAARWIGVLGLGLAMAGSIVLLTSEVSHEFIPGEGGLGMQFVGYGIHGVWFLMLAGMGVRTGWFSRRWIWAGRAAGAGSVLAMVLTVPFGPDSYVASTAFAVAFIAIVLWVVWTRQELRDV